MIVSGCDVGSLTAKAAILKDGELVASRIIRNKATAVKSATEVMDQALADANLSIKDIDLCCSTGYGRLEIPFSNMNMTEISCHALGAFWSDSSIRTIIDIGGQDCKAIAIGPDGKVIDFMMNDKCAAGTGRNLEIVADAIGVRLEDLGPLSLESRKPANITNKCSVFMELEVLQHIYRKRKVKDIAAGINGAVAKRVATLAKPIPINDEVCITGGVSKNAGVVKALEKRLGVCFKTLPVDAQLMGALGAAVFAMNEYQERN